SVPRSISFLRGLKLRDDLDDLSGGEPVGGRVGEDTRDERLETALVFACRTGLGGGRGDERPDAAARLEDALAFEVGVDARDGIGIDAELDGELADRGKLIPDLQPPRRDRGAEGALDLRVDRSGVALVDVDDSHGCVIVLVN